jgi:transcriptional regulator with PAS, ATPase and Fis domain
LSAVATPVALIGSDRKVLFFNQGFERLTGWEGALVVGSTCEYTTEGDPQSVRALLGSLCPPPRVFEGEPMEAKAVLPRQSGDPVARRLRHVPLLDETGQVDCVLVLADEIVQAPVPRETPPLERLHAELTSLRSELRKRFGISTIIAHSSPMLRVVEQVQLALKGKTAIVLEGEPGTGKEHIARVIHHEAARLRSPDSEPNAGAFVPLDCARMLPIDLKRTLRRLFRAAGEEDVPASTLPGSIPSTVYLQNVDAMPRDVQELVVTSFPANDAELRLMAGTSKSLESLVASDQMQAEFFYRISPLRISLPPLRNRPEDFPLLAQAFLERQNVGSEKQFEGFSEEVWKEFREYNWPGNLDELAIVIEEARTAAEGVMIGKEDSPFRYRMGRDGQSVGPKIEPRIQPLEAYLEQVEREQIEQALQQAKYNKQKTAELLGLTRPKLYRRMEALGIADSEGEASTRDS